jgi:polygalacturonase
MRPNFAVFWRCNNVLVEGVTFDDSPMWNVHLVYCENAIVRAVTINSLTAPNGDGVVVDSSKNVLVEYNHFETGDDAVVIKSGLNEDGLAINIPTENVVVRNFTAAKVTTGSGGVVFGSETSGGIRNIYVHDAFFDGSDRGIRFKTERGRGNVTENIYVENIGMRNLKYEAINFNTYYSGPNTTGPAPLIRNIFIRDINIDTVPRAISLIGLPEKWLENIVLENITIKHAKEGARINRVKNITLRNIDISSEDRAVIFSDSYEIQFQGIKLKDQTGLSPLLFSHGYLGAVIRGDLDTQLVELGADVPADLLTSGPRTQQW